MLADWLRAAAEGNTPAVLSELDRGAHIDALGGYGVTALMLAIEGRRIDTIKALVRRGAALDSRDDLGWTAMTRAVVLARGLVICQARCWLTGDSDHRPMRLLAAAGARMELREAILLCDTTLARRICDGHESPNISGSANFAFDQTYLMLAAQLGSIEIVELLLSRGADIEGKDDLGRTALISATEMGHLDVVANLLDRGAQIDARWPDETAFSAARERGHQTIASLLRSRGARFTLRDAVELGDARAVEELLRSGADANEFLICESRCVRLVTHAVRLGNAEIVGLFLEHEARLDENFFDERTLLAEAARAGHLYLVRQLIERGANVDAVGTDGLTALRWATREGQLAVAEHLKQAGATA
jgi:uncharacterized protein